MTNPHHTWSPATARGVLYSNVKTSFACVQHSVETYNGSIAEGSADFEDAVAMNNPTTTPQVIVVRIATAEWVDGKESVSRPECR